MTDTVQNNTEQSGKRLRTLAVIPAAGLSSRMKKFKPLMDVFGKPMLVRVIQNFRDAGIQDVAVITGFRAEDLLPWIRHEEAVPLYNPLYRKSDMFRSVRYGIEYAQNRFDQILLCPGDIPLFSCRTVDAVMMADADAAFPVYQGRTGHPVKLRAACFPSVLQYSGEDGLKGAIRTLQVRKTSVAVDDPYMLVDMDTPDVYERALEHYYAGTRAGNTEE